MLVNTFLFTSRIKMHCDVLWLLNKHTLQYLALPMVDRPSRLAISKDNASENVKVD